MQSSMARAITLALLAQRPLHAFFTPSAPMHPYHVSRTSTSRSMMSVSAEGEEQLLSTSRLAFMQRGAAAAFAVCAAIGVSVQAPEWALARDFAGIDVKGIDVSEVLHPGAGGGGGKATKPLRDCVLNVERVRVSTKQLEDDLTNKGAPPGLNGLVKSLIKNYKLDESLRQGAMYIESTGDRRTADSAGREALEYLAQTAEYFPPEIDDRTGMVKALNAEALEFTLNALGATRAKLDVYLSKLPPDALREARAQIQVEVGGES